MDPNRQKIRFKINKKAKTVPKSEIKNKIQILKPSSLPINNKISPVFYNNQFYNQNFNYSYSNQPLLTHTQNLTLNTNQNKNSFTQQTKPEPPKPTTQSLRNKATKPVAIEKPAMLRVKWPPNLLQYIEDCFCSAVTQNSKLKIHSALKLGITQSLKYAKNADTALEEIKWEEMPLLNFKGAKKFENCPSFKLLQTCPSMFCSTKRGDKPEQTLAIEPIKEFPKIPIKVVPEKPKEPEKIILTHLKTNNLEAISSGQKIKDRLKRFNPSEEGRFGDFSKQKGKSFLTAKSAHLFDKTKYAFTENLVGGEAISSGNFVGKIVGTSRALEKPYLRLTTKPDPSKIRPLFVLEKAFKMAVRKWHQSRNYGHFSEQMKSIRQDLSVQHIKTNFTIKVYETNARICIETSDLSEFNQCQTKLAELYLNSELDRKNQNEFLSYKVIYHIITRDSLSLLLLAREFKALDLSANRRFSLVLTNCLEMHRCLVENDFFTFFKKYKSLPSNCVKHLLDSFIQKVRLDYLTQTTKAFRIYPLNSLSELMGFEETQSCKLFVEKCGAKIVNSENTNIAVIDCKNSIIKSQLPVTQVKETQGVTHGSFDY